MSRVQTLTNTVIKQAVKDYRDALRRPKKHLDSNAAMQIPMELVAFLHSSRYATRIDIDQDYPSDQLLKEAVI